MSLTILKADKRSAIFKDWLPWLQHTSKLYDRFLEEVNDEYDSFIPLHLHEQACVSLFCAGAALSGYLPVAEYSMEKRGRFDKRKREAGRADFWFMTDRQSYSFEFKRSWFRATLSNLEVSFSDAINEAKRIKPIECDVAVAGLVSAARDPMRTPKFREFFKNKNVNFAFHIGPDDTQGTYLYFSVVRK
jgi:hypothetical protein